MEIRQKNPDVRSMESGFIFTVNVIKRIAIKLRRIILWHSGVITFRLHYGRDRKPFIVMISGFSDVPMTPKASIIYLWKHQDTPNYARSIRIIFKTTILENINMLKIHNFETFGKGGARQQMKIRRFL